MLLGGQNSNFDDKWDCVDYDTKWDGWLLWGPWGGLNWWFVLFFLQRVSKILIS